PDGLVDAGRLDDAAVHGEVAAQDGEAAVLGVGVLDGADAAALGVHVQGVPALGLGEGLGGALAAGGRVPEFHGLGGRGTGTDVPGLQPVGQGRAVDGVDVLVEQARAVQFAEEGRDAARPVHVLHVVRAVPRDVGRDLRQAGDAAREGVHLGEAVGDLRLLGGGQQVQDRVGGAAHRDVERHGVLEGRGGGDAAGQDRVVVLLVVAAGEVQDRGGRADVQVLAGGVGGEDRAVAREGQADGLGQAVHRVGGEHAGTGAAGGAGVLLDAEDVR